MSVLSLKQRTLTSAFQLTLAERALDCSFSEVLTTRKSVPYEGVTGIFHDLERCYVVWGGEVVQFLHEPRRRDYLAFLEELLRRVKASRGA